MKVNNLGRMAVVAFSGALSLGIAASPALADPTPVTDYGVFAAVGSDTTQDVMNGFGNVLTTSTGGRLIGNWDARGSATITTKAANCADIVRPNGSSQGRDALIASENDTLWPANTGKVISDCVDIARSSAGPRSTGSTYTYIPFGVDAVTVAISNESLLPLNWTLAQLQAIYRCEVTEVAGEPVVPLLIQSGSGTRQFWLAAMGITEAQVPGFTCIEDLDNTVQEHDGRVLDGHPEYILPFSVGQYLAQGNAASIALATGVTVENRRGTAILSSINGVAPVVSGGLNTAFPVPFRRDVYNVLPTTDVTNDQLVRSTFVNTSTTGGNNAAICTATVDDENGDPVRVTALFGFGYRDLTDGNGRGCGVTDLTGNS